MNYEEKYKQALERAKAVKETYFNLGNISAVAVLESIFPELKSEDEMIKRCIGMCLTDATEQRFEDFNTTLKDCLAWLEKQGEQKPVEQDTEIHDLWVYIREWNEKFGRLPKDEDELVSCIDYVMKRQKPADKVEPKFKVGDLIHNKWSNHSKEIVAVDDYQYTLNDGMPAPPFKVDIKEQDNWELVEQKHAWSEKHIAYVFEKVGLARIVRGQGNDQLTNAVQSAMIELSKQQNTAWSEEDRKHIDNIISLLNQAKERFVRESGQFPSWITEILWLESIKDRIQPQQEWSEYDKIQLSEAIQMIEANGTWIRSEDAVKKVSNWLKSLKPHWKPSEEQLSSLGRFIEGVYGCVDFTNIKSLYNELKQL